MIVSLVGKWSVSGLDSAGERSIFYCVPVRPELCSSFNLPHAGRPWRTCSSWKAATGCGCRG